MKNEKKWGAAALILTLTALLLLGGFTALVDPVFHYHKPLEALSYYLFDQRYQNDGIVKQFDYNAIITGTSMTENFRASELDALYDVQTVKVPYSGTSMREIRDNLYRAFRSNDEIRMVVIGLDGTNLMDDKDVLRSDVPLPTYLYDENPFNDVSYLLNKDILLKYTMRMLQQTYYGLGTTDFDWYSFCEHVYEHGPQAVARSYTHKPAAAEISRMDVQTEERIRQNIRQNVVQLAKDQPDTVFYCYFTPYSAVYWDVMLGRGDLQKQIAAYRIATEELLECENIRLYSFFDQYQWTEDLEEYRDYFHHSSYVNSQILLQFAQEDCLLTEKNYQAHWQQVQSRYENFDFVSYYQGYDLPVKQPE